MSQHRPGEIPEHIIEQVAERAAAKVLEKTHVLDAIAEQAAEKALQKVYAQVGQSVLRRLAWMAGIALLALLFFLAGMGAVKPTDLQP